MALWFHDAIYELSASDNESKSADWAMAELLAAGVATEAAQRIHGLVLITGHAAMPVTQDERLVVDIDLSILGAPPARFAEYEAQVRREYAWVPEPEFRDKREALLASFLARRSIYATNHFQERFEAQARRNLIGSIETLRGSQETP
jgi:predicted metal-dependent HD superfamily phosphohydrolase